MGRGCGVGVKILKIKCTYSFFLGVFLRFYCFLFIFLLFISLLLWDENPNGTSVPYLLFKGKNVKLKFCKDEEKIVKIFAAEGLLLDRRSERSTASVPRSAKKEKKIWKRSR